jgi:3-keto-5-aminohexanoate cleavage enzyme
MDKVIITAAVVGSRPTRDICPYLPYTPEEIAQSALDSWRAGAAVAHIHVRDPQTGAPSHKFELFQEVVERVRADSELLLNLTTSGLHFSGDAEEMVETRLEPLALKPELCSFDIGSMNFHDRVFLNPPAWGEVAPQRMQTAGVKPEIEVFDTGHIAQAVDLIERGLIDPPAWFQLCMGVRWGIPATEENLNFMVGQLPEAARWSVLGVGKYQRPMISQAIQMGGNIRVGFEDNLYLEKGVMAKSNAELVAMAVALVHEHGREVATPDETRSILEIEQHA